MPKIDDRMMVKLTIDGLVVYSTLWSFFDANELTKTEKKHILDALEKKTAYHGGGGAFAHWKLEQDRD